jgi:cellulose synthase/poly-beta-1,6-N-acetylglucosamine synthase-like glycosyltransferase
LPKPQAAPAASRPADAALPLYTILVPLYREARVLPTLAKAMLALDYPREKLQVIFVVEADDLETASVADAYASSGPFEVVRVPPSLPRTKPKATNFALRLTRGDFVVIYDAEDRPEPDQLRKAVAEFRRLPRRTACLQARLAFYNHNENWLTQLFALDYDTWFGVLLPGLDRIGVPMPLGGTSNHFRTSVLRAIHAWDPFNVTEDADLGIRLAQLGYRVAMLDSTTWEEAPTRAKIWIKQRSRWLKGYMQTWLVHGRAPLSLIRQVGLGGFLAFQLFIGGAILSALVNPVLWLIFILSNVLPLSIFGDFPGHAFGYVSAASAISANGVLTYLAMTGSRWRGDRKLSPYGLTVTVYWILISIAGYRGFWHLITKPFHWEKTAHGFSPQPTEASHD